MSRWVKISDETPPIGVEVDTKFETDQGAWNLVRMTYEKGKWFFGDHRMTGQQPTHWKLKGGSDQS